MDRATAPVVATAILVGIAILTASGVATVAFALETPAEPTQSSLSLTVDATTDRVVLTHRGGETIDVTELSLLVTVEGDELRHQPSVPFFSEQGFHGGPTGPFNSAGDPHWQAGDEAGFRLATTNEPTIERGDQVTVTLRRDGALVARTSARAR